MAASGQLRHAQHGRRLSAERQGADRLSFHYDYMSDPTDEDADLKARVGLPPLWLLRDRQGRVLEHQPALWRLVQHDRHTALEWRIRHASIPADTSLEGEWNLAMRRCSRRS